MNKSTKMCSGFGRYHHNNPDRCHAKPFLGISYHDIIRMAAQPATKPKQSAQWFIPSTLLTRSKATQMQHGEFYCLVADIDHKPPTLQKLADILLACWGVGFGFLIYTSRSQLSSTQNPIS